MNYFKPLRRKIGVLTLLMACVFMAGWVGSCFQLDDFEITAGAAIYGVESKAGGIDFSRTTSTFANQVREMQIFMTGPLAPEDTSPWPSNGKIKWRWDWAGFHIGEVDIAQFHSFRAMIPYWSIVIPLTLLSSWLLLSKPRKPITEPIGTEGT